MSYVSTSEFNDSHTMDTSDIRMVKLTSNEPQTFSNELDLVKSLENISLQDIDIEHKTCVARIDVNTHVAILKASFSSSYPFDLTIPKFSWLSGTNLDTTTTIKILQAVQMAAYSKIRQHTHCLVHCLKVLYNYLRQVKK